MLIRNFYSYAKEIKQAHIAAVGSGKTLSPEFNETFNLTLEILSYIKSGNWTRAASREKYRSWIACDFDYKLVCDKYRTNRASLDVFLHRQNRRIEKIIEEPFTLLKNNDIAAARISFYTKTGKFSADTELNYSILELLPIGSNKDSYILSDCRKEIALLRNLRKTNLSQKISAADVSKLGYLVFLMSTDDPVFYKAKMELVKQLYSGNMSGES